MNILVTLDKGYIKPLCVMLRSLLNAHSGVHLSIYCINKSLSCEDFNYIDEKLNNSFYKIFDIKIFDDMLHDAPISKRYPKEMYYRIFAAQYLPSNVDKILYLDPDLVVLKPLDKLYEISMGNNYFAAATHVGKSLQKINEIRLDMDPDCPYINSGVMLMNIALLKQEQDINKVFDYLNERKSLLMLPDQDIISGVYGDKIISIDPYVYNMTERLLFLPHKFDCAVDLKWVEDNSAIIHYCGRNKPWKDVYLGFFNRFYHKFAYDIE